MARFARARYMALVWLITGRSINSARDLYLFRSSQFQTTILIRQDTTAVRDTDSSSNIHKNVS